MSALSSLIANLESGGGAYASKQPASMVDPVYGQYGPFAAQYGSGAAGVDNYAQQFLAANPGATVGDFYANYVGGTGSASNPKYSLSNWPTIPGSQGSYQNLVNQTAAQGLSPTTPLASLLNGGAAAIPASAAGYTAPDGSSLSFDPTQQPFIPLPGQVASTIDPATGRESTDFAGGQPGAGGVDIGNFTDPSQTSIYCSIAPWACGPSGVAPGFSGLPGPAGAFGGSGATSDVVPGLFAKLGNFAVRAAVVLLGIILVAAAAWGFVRGENPLTKTNLKKVLTA